METTVKGTVTRGGHETSNIFGAVGSAVIVVSAIALSVAHFVNAASHEEGAEMDTTERLLSGGNRERVLAALNRRKQGSFIVQNRVEEWA